MNSNQKFVVDGARRRLDSDYAVKRKRELKEQFIGEFSEDLSEASFLKRTLIKRRIRKKVNDAIREEFDQGLEHLNFKMKL